MSTTEVWLYGSTARGDRVVDSDIDLLIVGDGVVDLDSLELPSDGVVSASRYSWPEVEQMASYGSLFLHHIRREGQPLIESPEMRMQRILSALGPYARADQELDCFSRVVDDVERSLTHDHSVHFELSVLATAARHAAILGCYRLGQPNFGRESAFRTLLPKLGYDDALTESVVGLYRYRRAEDENSPVDLQPSGSDVRDWILVVRDMISRVRGLCYGDV